MHGGTHPGKCPPSKYKRGAAMDHKMLVHEFLDELGHRARSQFGGKLHQAFIDWYIEAEFGRVDWKFTDDVSDGGIDAVIWRPGETPPVILLQSKFSEHFARNLLTSRAYTEFTEVVDAFYEGDEAFDEHCSIVRDELRRLYKKAYRELNQSGTWAQQKKAFRLITTSRRRSQAEDWRVHQPSYVYAQDILELYTHYRKGATPHARDLILNTTDRPVQTASQGGRTAYLVNARVSDFIQYLQSNDVARLVARNIRYSLGGKVGAAIRKTYEKDPNDFWYLHNGLTIMCDRLKARGGVTTLINPSVVNGAQTLYAISACHARNTSAQVTARIIVRGNASDQPIEDDSWVQRVIRGVNTQNRVRSFDFRSNEPEQVELQHLLREVRVFYERKRGEWKEVRNEPRYRGFDRLSLRLLGIILAVTSAKNGSGVLLVKRGVDTLFDEKHYRPLFPSRSKMRWRFERIYFAYRAYRLLDSYGYKNASDGRRQRHAFWNCLWLLYIGLTEIDRLFSQCSVDSLRMAFDQFEGNGRDGRSARKNIRALTRGVWRVWRKCRRADPERWTANNFFKSAYGNRQIRRFALPTARPGLHATAKALLR
jgi:hypothetical protein